MPDGPVTCRLCHRQPDAADGRVQIHVPALFLEVAEAERSGVAEHVGALPGLEVGGPCPNGNLGGDKPAPRPAPAAGVPAGR